MNLLRNFRIEQELVHEQPIPIWESGASHEVRLCEGRHYRLTASSLEPELALFVGDTKIVPSRVHQSTDSTVKAWNYSPEFFAGEIEIKLVDENSIVFSCHADVSPDSRKLGRTHYHELLEDLESRASSCLYGGRAGGLRTQRGGERYPPIAFLSQLSSQIDKLTKSFAAIVKAPHRNLVSIRHEAKIHQVRRIDAATVRSVARRPTLVAAIRGIVGARQQDRVNVPRRQHTFDTAPNRIALGYINALCRQCESLRDALIADEDLETLEETQKGRWLERLSSLQSRVDKFLQVPFFDGLKPRSEDGGAYIAVARHPEYNRFCRIARQILNPVTMLAVDSEQLMTLKPSYQLYEYWTFFAVADEIQNMDLGLTWTADFNLTEGSLFHSLRSKSKFVGVSDDLTVKVIFQANFSGGSPYSVTRACKPDIVVEIQHASWARPKRIVLDAKYRSAQGSIQTGIDDMHVYRDSVRYTRDEPAIESAYILTPIELDGKIYDPEFQREHGIGAVCLSPGNTVKMKALLKQIFSFREAIQK